MIFPCCSRIKQAPVISLTRRKQKCPKGRPSAPVREVSSEERLDCWQVLVHWPYLVWVLSLQQDLSWQRSAAGPLEPESAASREPWSVWASPSTKPSVMREK